MSQGAASAEIPGFVLQTSGQMAEIMYPVGNQVMHITVGLDDSVDGQQL